MLFSFCGLIYANVVVYSLIDARSDTKDINSAADLSQEYKTLRDASPNMHQNADSYRVFGALCSRSLYKRALIQDDPVRTFLILFSLDNVL